MRDSAGVDTSASSAAAPRMRSSVRRAARAMRVSVAIRLASGDKGAASSSKMGYDVQGRGKFRISGCARVARTCR